jgi:hypothetical protein
VQRKAYVTGAAAVLAVLLAGCSSGSGNGASPDDSKPIDATASAPPAPPGKYRTLPEACSQVDHSTLDSMLPGIKAIPDKKQREQAYAGTATLTYETDRRVGCRWSGDSPYATDHLLIDFERVVSYDTTVSDDTRAQQVFTSKETAAQLAGPPAPGAARQSAGEGLSPDSGDASADPSADTCDLPAGPATGAAPGSGSAAPGGATSASTPSTGAGGAQNGPGSRVLRGLGDAAFLDDSCTAPASAAGHRTVTVVFRTSNVIVTVEYDEQASRPTDVPDRKKMQDTTQDLAHKLAGKLSG